MEEKKKKGNAFVRWTEKHAEFWKFIKFNCAGALSNIPELATQLILVYLVFKCADAPESRKQKLHITAQLSLDMPLHLFLTGKLHFMQMQIPLFQQYFI